MPDIGIATIAPKSIVIVKAAWAPWTSFKTCRILLKAILLFNAAYCGNCSTPDLTGRLLGGDPLSPLETDSSFRDPWA